MSRPLIFMFQWTVRYIWSNSKVLKSNQKKENTLDVTGTYYYITLQITVLYKKMLITVCTAEKLKMQK